MKISQLTNDNLTNYLKLDDFKDLSKSEQDLIGIIKEAAVSYITSETGLDSTEVDSKDDLTIAYLCLCQDMYDNRSLQIDKNTLNATVSTILERHRVNLL